MTKQEIELQAKLEQAKRERDTTQSLALRKCVELTDRATAAESALAAAQGALRQVRDVLRETVIGQIDAALAAESGKRCGCTHTMNEHETIDGETRPGACRRCECRVYHSESGKPGGEAPAGTCANFWHPGHGKDVHPRREAVGDRAEVHKDFVHDSGCLNWTAAEPRAAPPALPAELGWEAPHPRHSCLECHGDCPTPDLCAEGAKRAPAPAAELSGKGEQREPGEAKKEES